MLFTETPPNLGLNLMKSNFAQEEREVLEL